MAENSKTSTDNMNKCLKLRTPASILLTESASGIESANFSSLPSSVDEFFQDLSSWIRKIGATITTLIC